MFRAIRSKTGSLNIAKFKNSLHKPYCSNAIPQLYTTKTKAKASHFFMIHWRKALSEMATLQNTQTRHIGYYEVCRQQVNQYKKQKKISENMPTSRDEYDSSFNLNEGLFNFAELLNSCRRTTGASFGRVRHVYPFFPLQYISNSVHTIWKFNTWSTCQSKRIYSL